MSGSKRLRLISFAVIFFSFFINLLFIGDSNAYSPTTTLGISGSNQMFIGQTQTLTAAGGCGEPYNWSINSGAGSLSSTTGSSVNYTALDSNPGCINNPEICVTDFAGETACRFIAVNTPGIDPSYSAYVKWEDKVYYVPNWLYGCCDITQNTFNCYETKVNSCTVGACCQYYDPWSSCNEQDACDTGTYGCGQGNSPNYNFALGTIDIRTPWIKSIGCCPAALLPPDPPPPSISACVCDLTASITASPSTIDGNSGGSVFFERTITTTKSFNWTLTIKNSSNATIATFSGSSAGRSEWKIKDQSDKLSIEPGTYTATLAVTTNDGYCETSANATIIIKDNPKTCPISIDSSLSFTSGNLNHSQTLFSVPNSPLMSGFTLTYNSRDGYNGVLGMGWSHNYNIILQYDSTQNIYVLMDGSGDRIALYNHGSVYTPDISAYPILIKNSNNTLTLTYKDGSVYNFNAQGKITAIADKNNNTVNFTYNSGSNLISIADQTGKTITLGYDANNRISSITDPNSNTYNLTYSGNTLTAVSSNNSLGTQTWTYTYDNKGFMLTKTDPQGNLFQYAYDANHNLIQTIDPLGRTRSIQFDPGNKTTTVTEKDGGVWIYKYDPASGTLTSKTDPTSGLVSNVYDANRNLISRTEAGGGTTTYTYDANNNQTSVTDALGKTTTYTYNSLNLVASVTDPNGHVTQYGYDANGNLTSVTDHLNNITQYQYDTKGNTIAIINPLGKTTSMTYDQNNNLIIVTDPKSGTMTMTYDSLGNMLTQTDALNKTTTFQYNSLNQMTQATDPLGKITHYTYDYNGNRLSSTDANSNTTQYAYNYKNQITQTTDALSNVTGLTYGGTGCSSCGGGGDRLIAVTDAKSQTTAYQYNTAGKLLQETDPLGKVTSYTYDSRGNMITRTSPDDKTITYTYDLNNRLTQKLYSDNFVTAFQYDNAGRMTYAGNSNIAYNFIYDAVNRVTQITDSNGRLIQYQYDAAGKRIAMTMPDSSAIAYTYDFNNLLTQITTDLGAFTYAYDANNRRTTRTLPNGTTSTYSYDQDNRLTGIQTAKGTTTIDSVTYTMDNVGNRLTKTQNSTGYNYTYDNIYRLTQAAPSTGTQETYTYDQVGNRLTKVPDAPPSVNAATAYTYDDENRLTGVQITRDNLVKALTFAYDPFGRRISKTLTKDEIGTDCTSPNVCPRMTTYVYDGQNIIMEYDQNGNITAKYTHGPNIDEPLAIQQGTNIYYYHADGLGSITALTNASGSIVQTYIYDSFGNMTATGSISQPFTYTAREYDAETGMYFYRARYYDPKVGRFVTKDPIGFKGGINVFAYVLNNPVNRTDPEGLYPGPCGNENYTWVPDYPFGFDFTGPCAEHDKCYGCSGKAWGKTKATCDLEFLWHMTKKCFSSVVFTNQCMTAALVYYIAVSRGGDDSFAEGRRCCY
jgi:RHS repeat-associated protein